VGTSGDFTNVPGAFVADATSPGTGQVTHVSAFLPLDAAGQPRVEIRMMVLNQPGHDEFVGIDNIVVEKAANLGAVASVAPQQTTAGAPEKLTVAVTPAPGGSAQVQVRCDLSALGAAADAALFDDGTHGDDTAGDLVFTRTGSVPGETAAGNYPIACTA